jgi:hypothetical protein
MKTPITCITREYAVTHPKGCWIDELTPAELGTLDVIEQDMVVSELEHRGRRLAELETTALLATVLLATTPPPSNEMALDPTALADRIAERVADRLGSGRTADIYTTRKGGPHIPGKSRDWMLRRIKEMPGARNVGKDWQITHADYERWLMEQDVSTCKAAAVPLGVNKTPGNVRDIAEAALARAGFRATK